MTTGFPHPVSGLFLVLAGVLGAGGVAAAAYAAHGQIDTPSGRLIDLAAQIMMIHAGALVGLAAAAKNLGRLGLIAGTLIGAGALLFALVMLTHAMAGPTWLAPLAPVGGSAMIIGWLMLAVTGLVSLVQRQD